MLGYTIDEFIDMRLNDMKEREEQHKDMTFHSCEHCLHWRRNCKILERKLQRKRNSNNSSWSCRDHTKCESWTPLSFNLEATK